MLGTPDYIAPEQSLDATKADIRADIYSLGCTLYYLLTGRPPFKGKESLYEILTAHHSRDAPLLKLVRPDVPAELAAVVAKMMAKDAGQRYQQPSEVAQVLALFQSRSETDCLPEGSGNFIISGLSAGGGCCIRDLKPENRRNEQSPSPGEGGTECGSERLPHQAP